MILLSMDSKGVLEARVFILIASIFIVIFIALLVAAVITSNQEEKQINLAGGDIHRNLGQQLASFFSGDKADEVINNNNPDPNNDGVIDSNPDINPEEDEDGDGVANINDIDINGDGQLNSQESAPGSEGVSGNVETNDTAVLKCGDTNGDDVLDQADLDAITSYAFEGVEIPSGVKVDLNGDGVVDILDVTIMTNHVKRGKPAPTCGEVANLAPVINSFEGLKYLKTNVEYSWNLTASDPEGKLLIYQVNFGDGTNTSILYNVSSSSVKPFSHKYALLGKYPIGVKVSDDKGLDSSLTKDVEVMQVSLSFCDFWSNDSLGIASGDNILARDKNGLFIGIANQITVDGSFLLHTYGDDPISRGVDEGPVMGENVSFYKDDKLCILLNGSNVWIDRGSKKITLDCS